MLMTNVGVMRFAISKEKKAQIGFIQNLGIGTAKFLSGFEWRAKIMHDAAEIREYSGNF